MGQSEAIRAYALLIGDTPLGVSRADAEFLAVSVSRLRILWALTLAMSIVSDCTSWAVLYALFSTIDHSHALNKTSGLAILILSTVVLCWLMTITWHCVRALWDVLEVSLLTRLALELNMIVRTIESSTVFTPLSTQSIIVGLQTFTHFEAASTEAHVAWFAPFALD